MPIRTDNEELRWRIAKTRADPSWITREWNRVVIDDHPRWTQRWEEDSVWIAKRSWPVSPWGERDRYYRLRYQGRRFRLDLKFGTHRIWFGLEDTTFATHRAILVKVWRVEPDATRLTASREAHRLTIRCLRRLDEVLVSQTVLNVL